MERCCLQAGIPDDTVPGGAGYHLRKKEKKKISITISGLVTVAECNFFDILFMKSVLTKDYITHTDGEPSL